MNEYKKSKLYQHAYASALELGAQLKKLIERPPTVEKNPLGDAILEGTVFEGAIAGLAAAFGSSGATLVELTFRTALDIDLQRRLKTEELK